MGNQRGTKSTPQLPKLNVVGSNPIGHSTLLARPQFRPYSRMRILRRHSSGAVLREPKARRRAQGVLRRPPEQHRSVPARAPVAQRRGPRVGSNPIGHSTLFVVRCTSLQRTAPSRRDSAGLVDSPTVRPTDRPTATRCEQPQRDGVSLARQVARRGCAEKGFNSRLRASVERLVLVRCSHPGSPADEELCGRSWHGAPKMLSGDLVRRSGVPQYNPLCLERS